MLDKIQNKICEHFMETGTLYPWGPGGLGIGPSIWDSLSSPCWGLQRLEVVPGKYSLAGSTLTDSAHPPVNHQGGCHAKYSIHQMPNGAFENISDVHRTELEKRIRARCTARGRKHQEQPWSQWVRYSPSDTGENHRSSSQWPGSFLESFFGELG